MLILFNTAYRPGYLKNVLRTIYLPCGAVNQYRYTLGDDLQISEADAIDFQSRTGQPVLMCFGDRFAIGGYEFHPLRRGKLIKVDISGGRVYFQVELGRHVSSRSVADFTKRLKELAAGAHAGMLRLTNDDPLCTNDGRYAIQLKDSKIFDFLDSNDHSWTETVAGLTTTKAFSDPEKKFVFAKCELLVNGIPRNYCRDGQNSWYDTERDDDLRLSISYVFPSQHVDRAAAAKMIVTVPSGLQLLSSTEHTLDMKENRIDIPFAFEGEKRFVTLDVKFDSTSGAKDVFGPDEAVAIKVNDTGWKKIVAIVCAGVYVVGAMFSTTDDNKPMGELLKGISLIGIFLALGSKKIV